MEDAIPDVGNESVIVTLNTGATYNLGATTTDTVTIVDGKVADIDGNDRLTGSDVFLINQYLLLAGNPSNPNRDSILEGIFESFGSETGGASNTTGAELSAAINAQLSLFDIDGNGNTTGGDLFLINQYLLLAGNPNRASILEDTANVFGSELNGPNNTSTELNAALSNVLG